MPSSPTPHRYYVVDGSNSHRATAERQTIARSQPVEMRLGDFPDFQRRGGLQNAVGDGRSTHRAPSLSMESNAARRRAALLDPGAWMINHAQRPGPMRSSQAMTESGDDFIRNVASTVALLCRAQQQRPPAHATATSPWSPKPRGLSPRRVLSPGGRGIPTLRKALFTANSPLRSSPRSQQNATPSAYGFVATGSHEPSYPLRPRAVAERPSPLSTRPRQFEPSQPNSSNVPLEASDGITARCNSATLRYYQAFGPSTALRRTSPLPLRHGSSLSSSPLGTMGTPAPLACPPWRTSISGAPLVPLRNSQEPQCCTMQQSLQRLPSGGGKRSPRKDPALQASPTASCPVAQPPASAGGSGPRLPQAFTPSRAIPTWPSWSSPPPLVSDPTSLPHGRRRRTGAGPSRSCGSRVFVIDDAVRDLLCTDAKQQHTDASMAALKGVTSQQACRPPQRLPHSPVNLTMPHEPGMAYGPKGTVVSPLPTSQRRSSGRIGVTGARGAPSSPPVAYSVDQGSRFLGVSRQGLKSWESPPARDTSHQCTVGPASDIRWSDPVALVQALAPTLFTSQPVCAAPSQVHSQRQTRSPDEARGSASPRDVSVDSRQPPRSERTLHTGCGSILAPEDIAPEVPTPRVADGQAKENTVVAGSAPEAVQADAPASHRRRDYSSATSTSRADSDGSDGHGFYSDGWRMAPREAGTQMLSPPPAFVPPLSLHTPPWNTLSSQVGMIREGTYPGEAAVVANTDRGSVAATETRTCVGRLTDEPRMISSAARGQRDVSASYFDPTSVSRSSVECDDEPSRWELSRGRQTATCLLPTTRDQTNDCQPFSRQGAASCLSADAAGRTTAAQEQEGVMEDQAPLEASSLSSPVKKSPRRAVKRGDAPSVVNSKAERTVSLDGKYSNPLLQPTASTTNGVSNLDGAFHPRDLSADEDDKASSKGCAGDPSPSTTPIAVVDVTEKSSSPTLDFIEMCAAGEASDNEASPPPRAVRGDVTYSESNAKNEPGESETPMASERSPTKRVSGESLADVAHDDCGAQGTGFSTHRSLFRSSEDRLVEGVSLPKVGSSASSSRASSRSSRSSTRSSLPSKEPGGSEVTVNHPSGLNFTPLPPRGSTPASPIIYSPNRVISRRSHSGSGGQQDPSPDISTVFGLRAAKLPISTL